MNKGLIFAAGTVFGSAVTWNLVKNKYEALAQEEINSVKSKFAEKEMNSIETEQLAQENQDKSDISEYISRLQKAGYALRSDSLDRQIGKNQTNNEAPYVITPEDFDTNDDYEKITLTYYADNIVADENDDPIEDVDHVIGVDSLTHFGEYEEDAVYIRNDRMKTDYELLRDLRTYSSVVGKESYMMEE